MLKLGDRVRFVNENMEGIVTALMGHKQVGVTVDNDFEIPVLINEVVKIEYDSQSAAGKPAEKEKPPRVASVNPLGVFLAFERYAESNLQLHVHNNLSEVVTLAIYHKEQGVYKLAESLRLERDETRALDRYDMSRFESWQPVFIQMLVIEETTIKPVEPIQYALNFHAKTFHQTLKHCFFLNRQAYMMRIDETQGQLDTSKLLHKDFNEKAEIRQIDLAARPAEMIDLHYPSLVSNGYGTSTDITGLQMEVFAKTMEAAWVHKMKQLIYIHGVGNMYLKNKIRTWLSKHTDMVASYEDADILKYGGGATLVFLK